MRFVVYNAAQALQAVKKIARYDAAGNRQYMSAGYVYDAAGAKKKFFDALIASYPTMTAAVNGVNTGYSSALPVGSITPDPAYLDDKEISGVYRSTTSGKLRLELISATPITFDFFDYFTVKRLSDGVEWTQSSVAATFSAAAAPHYTWEWTAAATVLESTEQYALYFQLSL